MITIKSFPDRIEGEIVADLLSSIGIECLFLSDDAGGMKPHLGMMTGYRIQVNKSDAENAIKIIEAFEKHE